MDSRRPALPPNAGGKPAIPGIASTSGVRSIVDSISAIPQIRQSDERTRREDMSSTLRNAGEAAPAFQLPNQDGVPSDLADFRGHYLLLWWYPKADTPG